MDIIDRHLGMECERGKDRDLRRGIMTFDICSRICFSESESLRFLQDILVLGALFIHLGQDVVGGSIDDTHHARDAVAYDRFTERPKDRDRTTYCCLVIEVYAIGTCGSEYLCAVCGKERLIGSDNRLLRIERLQDQRASRLDPTHDFDDDRNARICDDRWEIGGEK